MSSHGPVPDENRRPDASSRSIGSTDAVEAVLFDALAGPEDGWKAAVDRACAEHPALADPLRRRFAQLVGLGLDREGAAVRVDEALGKAAPERLGDYRLIEVLGSGGMGIVYLAEQESMKRLVALKLIRGSDLALPQVRLRFRREIEAASKLEHPGICTVFEAGEAEGQPYIAMRFVKGITLAEHIGRETSAKRASRDSVSSASHSRGAISSTLALFEKVARALDAAHEAGLVHRDIKPANIMLTEDMEPVILDFGLASVEDSELGSLTLSSSSLGTPAYMSPEQIEGAGQVDRRTDVYSLGVALYETLTGKRPFEAPTREGLYRQILTTDPADPRRLGKGISGELKVVLDTALEKDPAHRYQTALDLAEDLRRLQALQPTRARAAGPALRIRRWVQRNPVGAVLLTVLAVALATTLTLLRQVSSERGDKDQALQRARASALANASANELATDPTLALLLAREALDLDETQETRSRILHALSDLHERQFLWQAQMVGSAVYSPTGDRILSACGVPHVAILSTRDGQVLRELGPHGNQVVCALFSPDGERILTGGLRGRARLWDGAGDLVAKLPPTEGVARGLTGYLASKAAAWSADGEVFCMGFRSGEAHLYDRNGIEVTQLVGEHEDEILCVAIAPDGKSVATGSRDGRGVLWSSEGDVLERWEHGAEVTSVCFGPGGRLLTSSSADRTVRVRDLEQDTEWALLGHAGVVLSAAFSPDGSLIATSSQDRTVRLWSASGKQLLRITDYQASVSNVEFSPGGEFVLGCSNNGVALVHDLKGRLVASLLGHEDRVTSAVFHPSGEEVLTASIDGTVRTWSLNVSGFPVLRGHELAAKAGAFSPDGDCIATASIGGDCVIYDDRGVHVTSLDTGSGVYSLAWSSAGDRLLTGTTDGTVTLWDASGSERLRFRPWSDEVAAAAFSPDGSRVVVCALSDSCEIWSLSEDGAHRLVGLEGARSVNPVDVCFLAGGERLIVFGYNAALLFTKEGERLVRFPMRDSLSGTVSAQGDRVLIGTGDGTLVLLDPTSDELVELRRFGGSSRGVYSVAFSPTGDMIAAGSKDGTVSLWSIEGELLATLPHGGIIWSVDFSPDGARVLSTSSLGTARLWPVSLSELSEAAAPRLTRRFLPHEVSKYEELLGPRTRDVEVRSDSADSLNLESWDVVRNPGASSEDYSQALRKAEAACARRPNYAPPLNTLGVARYRVGLFGEAVETLTRADRLNRAARKPYARACDVAFLAMSRHQLGELEGAQAILRELRELTVDETDPELLGIVAEAMELIGGGPVR